jgi:hypothetical protein
VVPPAKDGGRKERWPKDGGNCMGPSAQWAPLSEGSRGRGDHSGAPEA